MDDALWQDDPNEKERLERTGRMAAILGVLAMFFGMIMGCTYYVTLIPAIGCGIAAVWMANQVIHEDFEGAGRAYANVGLWAGSIASIFGVLIMLLCGLLIVLYVGIFGALAVAGSL